MAERVSTTERLLGLAWPVALLCAFIAAFWFTVGAPDEVTAGTSPCEQTWKTRADVAALERCLALDPRDVGVMTDLADAYAGAGADDRAETMYRRALAVDPNDGEVHIRLGMLLLSRGDRHGAGVEGRLALRSRPGSLAAARLVNAARDVTGQR